MALDAAGNLYIADKFNCRVRKVSGGTITTVAGDTVTTYYGWCAYSGDGGPATSAALAYPSNVALDGDGNLYIADTGNCRVRKVSAGTITTVAGGSGACGYEGNLGDGGPATSAFVSPTGVALDGAGNLYVADVSRYLCRVRKVTSGTITTVAGGACGYGGDGGPATRAALSNPQSVALDGDGNLYIADTGNNRVREVFARTAAAAAVGGAIELLVPPPRPAGSGPPALPIAIVGATVVLLAAAVWEWRARRHWRH